MSLKLLNPGDAGILEPMDTACFPDDPWGRKGLQSHLDYHEAFLWESPTPLAYLLLCLTPWEAEIFRIGVLPSHQNQGLGRKFLSAVFQVYPNLDFFLEVKESNLPALHLYESVGFQKIDQRKSYYPDGSSAFVLQRRKSE